MAGIESEAAKKVWFDWRHGNGIWFNSESKMWPVKLGLLVFELTEDAQAVVCNGVVVETANGGTTYGG